MNSRATLGAFIVAAALFSAFPFVFGTYQEMGAFRDALKLREQLVQDRQEALDNVSAELEQYRMRLSGDTADKFAAMVPTSQSVDQLISSLDAIANESGVVLAGVNLSGTRQQRRESQTGAVDITMEATGTYANFLNFLSALERNVRLMDIQTLDIGPDDSGELTFDVSVRAYFLP